MTTTSIVIAWDDGNLHDWVGGSPIFLTIYRNAISGSDTMSGDAQVVAVQVRES